MYRLMLTFLLVGLWSFSYAQVEAAPKTSCQPAACHAKTAATTTSTAATPATMVKAETPAPSCHAKTAATTSTTTAPLFRFTNFTDARQAANCVPPNCDPKLCPPANCNPSQCQPAQCTKTASTSAAAETRLVKNE